MKETVKSLVEQGNGAFSKGDTNTAILYYYRALQKAKVIPSLVKYVNKYKNNLRDQQETVNELLQTKYHIHLPSYALSLILLQVKNQIDELETKKRYQRFKKLFLKNNPKDLTQHFNTFLDNFPDQSSQEMEYLTTFLQEQGYHYSINDIDYLLYERRCNRQVERLDTVLSGKKLITLSEIDHMGGHEFEQLLLDNLPQEGYRVSQKKKSGEQGLDLLLERPGETIACQVKRSKKPVGNRAVQEALGAKKYYECDSAMVITNSTFTKPAKQLAEKAHVVLWDRDVLKEKFRNFLQ